MSYKGTEVTKCVPNLLIEAGNVGGDGRKTIYGNSMPKESTEESRFDKRGLVAMVDTSDHTVGSKFFITLGDFSFLNYKAVIVGEVIEGLPDLFALSRAGDSNGNLATKATISDCKEGETLHLVEPHHGHGSH